MTGKIKTFLASPQHEVAYKDLTALLKKHSNHLTPLDILAIAANMVGKLIALQDQRTVTPEMAMEIVAQNVEQGNLHIIGDLVTNSDGRA